MKLILCFFAFFLLTPFNLMAQNTDEQNKATVDSLYREDQFYVGITVNFLNQRPKGVKTESFVGSMHFGFLRDMPINERRNIALAAGLGYAYNNYGHNLFVGNNQNDESVFIVLNDDFDFDKNRFETHEIELPLELRWRTSTPESYKFWRIYGGVKLGYVFYFKSVFKNDNEKLKYSTIDEFNRLRYTAFMNFGFNNINFQVQYNINSFFNSDATVEGVPINMTAIKIGLMFYIL
ncbi:outer membrane beta-barrel protein [Planktosalinus lacus]|nr:outer membrane beta-barrel protein [Planktosalinus lacus]